MNLIPLQAINIRIFCTNRISKMIECIKILIWVQIPNNQLYFGRKPRNSTYADIRVTRIPRKRTDRVTREQTVVKLQHFTTPCSIFSRLKSEREREKEWKRKRESWLSCLRPIKIDLFDQHCQRCVQSTILHYSKSDQKYTKKLEKSRT